jgi:primosomal protein N' (replication factor Y)
MANVKPGVTRLREELEAAANRPVLAVTGTDDGVPTGADVFVGTEAVLHRVRDVDTVCFLDADAELLAPRYRAAEQFSALVVRASRLVGTRDRGGVVMVHTHVPDHALVLALQRGELHRVWDAELQRRQLFRLPPYAALALVEGQGADEFVASTGLEAAPSGERGMLVRAPDWMTLGAALATAPRPKGSRLRVEVDPQRA